MLMWSPKDMPLVDTESDPRQEEPKSSAAAHRLGYFLWKRRSAKCL